jgi:epoxyqueuosine reductase
MTTISDKITEFLYEKGASLIGFADLIVLPAETQLNLPRAVSFAVALTPDIVASIREGPTKEYHSEYERVNNMLGELSASLATMLRARGF